MFRDPFQIAQAFKEFRSNFHGDPKKEVERLISEGRITQAQLEELSRMAKEVQDLLKCTNGHL